MTPLPESELSAIAARADAATPGPWEWGDGWNDPDIATDEGPKYADLGLSSVNGVSILPLRVDHYEWRYDSPAGPDAVEPSEADRAFLAAARSDVPALVAEVRRLQAAVEALTPLARLGLNARQWAAENMQNVEEVLEIARQAVDRLAEINDSKQGSA